MQTTEVFHKNAASASRTVVNIGGARSSKSYSIAQLLLMRANNGRKIIGITRKTMPALRRTSYQLFIDLLKEYGRYFPECHNQNEDYYTLGESRIYFFSLDIADKLKSTEFNYIWMEEANEFEYEDYIVLLTRLSARCEEGERNQIFLSLNPSDSSGWIPQRLLQQKDVDTIYSTHTNNPFLSQDYVQTLLDLKEQDEDYYRVYAMGQWGKTRDLVYPRYFLCDELPTAAEEIFWGLDFGFNSPSALVKIALKEGALYVCEKLYGPGKSTADIISTLAEEIPQDDRHQYIFADSAEPDRIAEIFNAGFNIHPSEKSVRDGIMSVKKFKLFIAKDSPNLIKEIKNYKWKSDMAGNILEEPVKFQDHALDALRYGVHSLFKERASAPTITVI
ncbi:MAG: PBSX family phage terminase large subunit [Elusimicrobia bacterium]|nr:PBSX family phage terminase large subunit [Elusimicrobiota bacterium]